MIENKERHFVLGRIVAIFTTLAKSNFNLECDEKNT